MEAPKAAADRFVVLRATPLGDPRLAFSIVAPRDWQPVPIGVTPQALADDSRSMVPLWALAARRGSAVIEVRYLRVPPNVSLTRFLDFYLNSCGGELVDRRSAGLADEALLRLRGDFGVRLLRLSASRHDELIFVVAGSCREEEIDSFAEALSVGAATFRVSQPSAFERELSVPTANKPSFDSAALAQKLAALAPPVPASSELKKPPERRPKRPAAPKPSRKEPRTRR